MRLRWRWILLYEYFTNSNFFLSMTQQPNWAMTSTVSELHDHTQTHHPQYNSSGRVISPSQTPLPDNTQYSLQTNIHPSGGILTRNSSKQAAADPRLRPHGGHWDRFSTIFLVLICEMFHRLVTTIFIIVFITVCDSKP